MTTSNRIRNSQSMLACYGEMAGRLAHQSNKEPFDRKVRRVIFLLLVAAALACLSVTAEPQSLINSEDSSGARASTAAPQLDLVYARPTQRTMAVNYIFDGFGPYPIAGAAFAAGINQLGNSPPE
ncbi:MAG: hypothetical protein ABR991_10925, partial [Terracidiphilus sp.]